MTNPNFLVAEKLKGFFLKDKEERLLICLVGNDRPDGDNQAPTRTFSFNKKMLGLMNLNHEGVSVAIENLRKWI